MDDKQVRKILEKLVHEVEEGKYAYYDYSNILLSLLYLQANGLFTGDINHIQTIMIDMIKKILIFRKKMTSLKFSVERYKR